MGALTVHGVKPFHKRHLRMVCEGRHGVSTVVRHRSSINQGLLDDSLLHNGQHESFKFSNLLLQGQHCRVTQFISKSFVFHW